MSEPPRLFSWAVDENWEFTHLDTVNVTTSSCYFSDDGKYAYTAGGNGTRINALTEDGGIGEEIQEMLYVPKESIDEVDKTRAAVLYGAHAFDLNANRKAFVPHLFVNSLDLVMTHTNSGSGWDANFMYDVAENGTAELLSINLSPEAGDGPRNSYPSPNGNLYMWCITEHTQYLDVYDIGETRLEHKQRGSVIPDDLRGQYTYQSNTVQPSRDGIYLFASTRAWNNTEANGSVAAFELDDQGYLASEEAVSMFKAPLTLGSAAGLRVAFWDGLLAQRVWSRLLSCVILTMPPLMRRSGWTRPEVSADMDYIHREHEHTARYNPIVFVVESSVYVGHHLQ